MERRNMAINYNDILPDNWIKTLQQSNNTHLNNTAKLRHPFTPRHIRICLDRENNCPLKKLTGCQTSHCILRYPTENQLKNFL